MDWDEEEEAKSINISRKIFLTLKSFFSEIVKSAKTART